MAEPVFKPNSNSTPYAIPLHAAFFTTETEEPYAERYCGGGQGQGVLRASSVTVPTTTHCLPLPT